jgi:hypothetical protein
LDECVDHRLAHDLDRHEVGTVTRMGWQGKSNGELLALAAKHFDVFVTTDRNLGFQQNIPNLDLAVIVLCARTNRLSDVRELVPELLKVLPFVQPGRTRHIGPEQG